MSTINQSSQRDNAPLSPDTRVRYEDNRAPSSAARKLVFAKGIFDVLLSISVMFLPSLAYNGPVGSMVSKMTGLRNPDWAAEADSAFAIASLIMGAGIAALTAAQSESNCAYRTIASFNGSFALTGLLTCLFSPHHYGSTFLLLACLQDVFWYTAIVRAGGYGFADCLGVSTRGLYVIEERLSRDVRHAAHEIKQELHLKERKGKEHIQDENRAPIDSTRQAATGVETRSEMARENVQKAKKNLKQEQEHHKKGLEQSDLGPRIPASVN